MYTTGFLYQVNLYTIGALQESYKLEENENIYRVASLVEMVVGQTPLENLGAKLPRWETHIRPTE